MLNLSISVPVFVVSLIASALLLRKMLALRAAALRAKAVRAQKSHPLLARRARNLR